MATGNNIFDHMVDSGNPVGEVVAVDRFIIKILGLQPIAVHALVMFEDGSKGFVQRVDSDYVVVLHLGNNDIKVGAMAVVQNQEFVCKVGKEFVGRVITATGDPIDGKGPIAPSAVWPVFNSAPELFKRQLVENQVDSGVVAIDSIFPLVRGQRMSLVGDSKSGKSTLATQLAINQKNNDQVVVYCLIAKRQSDIDILLNKLQESGELNKAIVVVSTMFESLIMNYIAPYIACSLAEYLWQECNQDTIIVYDDLTSHAQTYREIALISGVSPGRDSYPGDMYYVHSSLLERAGRLKQSGKSLTAIPIVNAANGDISAYLPTNIMSMTDGQWILDMEVFRSGVRPAINTGQSVTRVGSTGHSKRQKEISSKTLKILADYKNAEEFSRFGSELSVEAKQSLEVGDNILQLLTQGPEESYSLLAQQLMLDIVLNAGDGEKIDIDALKLNCKEYAKKISKEEDFELVRNQLKDRVTKAPDQSVSEPVETVKSEVK